MPLDLADGRTLARLCLCLMFVSGLTAHVAGCQIHTEYRLWQPFCGGSSFVLAQGFGWALYVISLPPTWQQSAAPGYQATSRGAWAPRF